VALVGAVVVREVLAAQMVLVASASNGQLTVSTMQQEAVVDTAALVGNMDKVVLTLVVLVVLLLVCQEVTPPRILAVAAVAEPAIVNLMGEGDHLVSC
jgi:hypothetical protein